MTVATSSPLRLQTLAEDSERNSRLHLSIRNLIRMLINVCRIFRLEQVRRQSNIADSLNTDMTDILREKDETIAQLEEKLIENDQKMEELRDELR